MMMTTTALITTRRRLVADHHKLTSLLSSKSFFSTQPTTRTAAANNNNVDVLIIGGGAVGSTLANLLVERAPGCQIGLVDRAVPSSISNQSNIPHARAYALSPKSLSILGPQVLSKLASSSETNKGRIGGMYDSMQIWESNSPATLLFSSQHDLPSGDHEVFQETSKYVIGDDDPEQTTQKNYLGAVVEDTPLVQALWSMLKQPSQGEGETTTTASTTMNTSLYAPATIQSIDDTSNPGSVRVTLQRPSPNNNDKEDDEIVVIDTKLLVAADGANSFVRNNLQITWEGYDYGRTAMTCVVELQSPMPPRAFQRFLPAGPLALLPTWSPHHATVVWSTMPSHASDMKNYNDTETLKDEINSVLQEGPSRSPSIFPDTTLGKEAEKMVETLNYGMTMAHWTELETTYRAPPLISNIAGPPLTFPLSCRYAPSYAKGRVVLVGDAAHTVHPMAGQGLNLGLGDVDVLSLEIAKAWKSGMDVSTFVQDYQIQRQRHVGMVQTGIHTLHQVFGMNISTEQQNLTDVGSTSVPGIMTLKSLGMNFINHAGPVRRQLAAVAAGIV